MDQAAFLHFTAEVIRRLEEHYGFAVQPRRWVVERRMVAALVPGSGITNGVSMSRRT
jgi:hypothetical protein